MIDLADALPYPQVCFSKGSGMRDVVDGLFNDCKAALIDLIKSPDANGEAMVDLLMISKYFERIGDHAVNIAKWVLFSITGTI